MGAVNTTGSIYSSSHISLENIDPLFNSDTPIYLVVDAMKHDNADFDVDVTLAAPVSNFWKSYPENGKTHVEIRTKIDTDDNIVRTVTCTCASGRVYTNIFTKNNSMEYTGRYSDTVPAEELYYNDIKTLVSYAVNPSLYRDDRTTHFDALMSAVYGVDVNTSKSYTDITLGANGIKPHELITSGRLFEFIWWLLEKGVAISDLDTTMSSTIPILSTNDKIALFSNALDVRFSVYELFLTLCSKYGLITGHTPSLPMYNIGNITPDIVVAAYIASTQWKYTGWTCVDESCVNMAERCNSCIDINSAEELYQWNTNGMYNVVTYSLYDTIEGAVTNEHLDIIIGNGSINTKQIPFNCPDAVISLNNIINQYNTIGISYGDLAFRPIEKSVVKFIIHKKSYAGKGDIKDIITARCVHFIGDTDINYCDTVTANLIFDTNDGFLSCETNGTNIDGVVSTESDIDKYLGAFTTETITLGTPDNTSSNIKSAYTYYWFNFGDRPYIHNGDIGAKIVDLNIYGNSVEGSSGKITDTYVRVVTSNANIITNQTDHIVSAPYINPLNNSITEFSEDVDTHCINTRTDEYIAVPRVDGDTNTSFKLLARVETVEDPDKTKAHFAILTLPSAIDDMHDVIPCPFDNSRESCDIVMDITIEPYVKYIYLAYDSNVITKVKSVCIVPATESFVESRYTRVDGGISLRSIPVLTDEGAYDVRYKDKLTKNGDGSWVVEKRILPSKIHVKSIIGNKDDGDTVKAVFVNDAMVDVKCDIASSDPDSGKYIFYLGNISAVSEYGNANIEYGVMPIYIFDAKDTPASVARITSRIADIAHLPVGTSIADTEIDDYIIDIPMVMRGTECVPAGIGYIVDTDGNYVNTSGFTASVVDSPEMGYDVRGNRVAEGYGANIAVACSLTANVTDPVEAFIAKLESKPIDFRFAPIYKYNEDGSLSAPYPVTKMTETGYTTSIEEIPLEVPIDAVLQSQYNNLCAYRNGYMGLVIFDANAYLEAKYIVKPLSSGGTAFNAKFMTMDEYEALESEDPNITYFIYEN